MHEKVMIGIDLGGTNLRIGAVDCRNEIHSLSIIKSSAIANAKNPVIKLCEIIQEYIDKNKLQKIEGISVGVPSSVANDKETVICTTNIVNEKGKAVFINRNIAKEIRQYFNVPVFVNNDINNLMIYDVIANHLEKNKIIVGIYIGTGVGASVMVDGNFLEGKNGAELDIGHMPFYRGNEICSCGKKGCCECYASGWKLMQIKNTRYPNTSIDDIFTKHGEERPLKDFVEDCANVYAIMATIFNPDTIIVGGGVMEMNDFPKKYFEESVNKSTGKDVMTYGFQYVYSKEFPGKGVIGSVLFARNRMQNTVDQSCV